MNAAIEAQGLLKHYDDVEAVRGVDLRVEAGEIFGFLGPNGAGKSTTVRMLTTLLTITAGRAEVAGVDVAQDPDGARKRIGVALQEAGLDPRQTGRELLVLQGRLFGLTAAEAQERAEALLQLVELEDAADRLIKTYSGGMKRRLDLASALVHEPEVLFLDEPTNHLDPRARSELLELVAGLGMTVIAVLHDLALVTPFATRVAVMSHGRLHVLAPPREALTQQLIREIFGVDVFRLRHPTEDRELTVFEVPNRAAPSS
jgi:ABC-type multidrug transport system ATPase subunit